MARIPGRNSWIAVPAGLICAGVVGALVWLSLPMVPVAAAWLGQTARTALTQPLVVIAAPVEKADVSAILDCHDLYPEGVWAELLWRGDGLLAQATAAPVSAATTVVEALAPDVRLSCSWTYPDGSIIVSTLAVVGKDAAAIAQAGFESAGFTCESDAAGLRCDRSSGAGSEDHVLRDGLWLSSTVTGWHPDDYATRLSGFVLG